MYGKSEYNQIKALYKYVSLYNRRVNRTELETVLKSSPSYPSLLSIYHSLEFYDIYTIVARANKESLYGLNHPCLLHIKDANSEYFLLMKYIDKRTVVCYDTFQSKYVKLDSESILSNWDGVLIYTEQKVCRPIVSPYWFIAALITFVSLFHLGSFLFTMNLWGLSLSLSLLLHENEIHTSLVEKVCRIGQAFDCNKVTHSDASRIIGISLSVWGCLYFFSMILMLLMTFLGGTTQEKAANYMLVMDIGCLPMLVYSLVKQLQLKKWCVLCLSITFVILLEVIFLRIRGCCLSFSLWHAMFHLLGVTIACLVLLLLQKELGIYKEYRALRIQALKMKRNPTILRMLLRNAKILETSDNSYLSLGNTQAPVVITTWISPFCGHCSKVVSDMLNLYGKYSEKMEWRIYLSGVAFGRYNENRIQCTLLAFYRKDKLLFLKALKEWFLHKRLLPIEDCNLLYSDKIKIDLTNQMAFTAKMNIENYPACFINGWELPSVYTIKDISYMIDDEDIWLHSRNR